MIIDLQPFLTPNFARMVVKPGVRQDGFKEAPSFPLSELDTDSLAKLCDDFRAEVFKKAGKTDPAIYGRCTCGGCGKVVPNAWRDEDGHHCLTCLAKQRDKLREGLKSLEGAIKRSDELYQQYEGQRNALLDTSALLREALGLLVEIRDSCGDSLGTDIHARIDACIPESF